MTPSSSSTITSASRSTRCPAARGPCPFRPCYEGKVSGQSAWRAVIRGGREITTWPTSTRVVWSAEPTNVHLVMFTNRVYNSLLFIPMSVYTFAARHGDNTMHTFHHIYDFVFYKPGPFRDSSIFEVITIGVKTAVKQTGSRFSK